MSKSKQSRRKFLSKQFKTIESRGLDNFVRWGRTKWPEIPLDENSCERASRARG